MVRWHWLFVAFVLGGFVIYSTDGYQRHFQPEKYWARQVQAYESSVAEARKAIRFLEEDLRTEHDPLTQELVSELRRDLVAEQRELAAARQTLERVRLTGTSH